MSSTDTPQKVLIIDDDEIDLMIIQRELKKRLDGCAILEATNKAEVFEHLKTDVPDLILSDVNLGIDSGFDIAETVKTWLPDWTIPYIFMSGLVTESQKIKAKEFAPHVVLEKPVNSQQNAEFIAKVLEAFKAQQNGSALTKSA